MYSLRLSCGHPRGHVTIDDYHYFLRPPRREDQQADQRLRRNIRESRPRWDGPQIPTTELSSPLALHYEFEFVTLIRGPPPLRRKVSQLRVAQVDHSHSLPRSCNLRSNTVDPHA